MMAMMMMMEVKLTAVRQVIQGLCCSKCHLFDPHFCAVLSSAPQKMQHEAVPADAFPPKEPHRSASQNPRWVEFGLVGWLVCFFFSPSSLLGCFSSISCTPCRRGSRSGVPIPAQVTEREQAGIVPWSWGKQHGQAWGGQGKPHRPIAAFPSKGWVLKGCWDRCRDLVPNEYHGGLARVGADLVKHVSPELHPGRGDKHRENMQ